MASFFSLLLKGKSRPGRSDFGASDLFGHFVSVFYGFSSLYPSPCYLIWRENLFNVPLILLRPLGAFLSSFLVISLIFVLGFGSRTWREKEDDGTRIKVAISRPFGRLECSCYDTSMIPGSFTREEFSAILLFSEFAYRKSPNRSIFYYQ